MGRVLEALARVRERVEGSWVLKGALLAGGLFGAARALGAGSGPVRLDHAALKGLERLRFDTAKKLRNLDWLVDELRREQVFTLDEIAVLCTIATWETNVTASAVSGDGLPDDAVGKSWGPLQFSLETIQGLGWRKEQVWAPRGASDALVEQAMRGSARFAAVSCRTKPGWTGGRPWLEAVRAMHGDDVLSVAREFCVRWQAGPGRRWTDIMRAAPSRRPGTLGYVQWTTRDRLSTLPAFRRALGLPPLEAELLGWVRSTPLAATGT